MIFLLLASTQAHAVLAQNCPNQDVVNVQKIYDRAVRSAQSGLIAPSQLHKLEWALQDVKYCAHQISVEQYCASMKTTLTQYIENGANSTQLGDFSDLTQAIDKLIFLREICPDRE